MGLKARLGFVLCGLLLVAAKALAHDPPYIRQLLWDDSKSDELWLYTNRGLIMGSPDEAYRLLCTQGMGVTSNEPVAVIRTGAGHILLGSSSGLVLSTDGGCSFVGVEPFGETPVYGLTRDTAQEAVLWMVTGDAERALYSSSDEGMSFQSVYTLDPDDYFMQLMGAESDSNVLYARILQLGDGDQTHLLGRSSDGGTTWSRLPVPLLPTEAEYSISAVHPQDANRLLIKTLDNTPALMDRVLTSADGGASFTEVLQVAELKAAQYSADGETILVSGRDGLWISSDGGSNFTQAPEARRMSYATIRDGGLYAAGYFDGILAGLDGIGHSEDEGQTFEPFMLFTDVRRQVDCPAESPTALACATLWNDWAMEFPAPGATVLDAGQDTDTAATVDAGVAEGGGVPDAGDAGDEEDSAEAEGRPVPLDPGAQGAAAPTPGSETSAGGSCSITATDNSGSRGMLLAGLIGLWVSTRIAGRYRRRRFTRQA